MHRLTALFLILPTFAFVGADPRRHVHVYTNHDHHDHHHGPAVHEHHQHEQPDVMGFEACEPGHHTLRVSVAWFQSVHFDAGHVDLPVTPVIEIRSLTSAVVSFADVRVHGPPSFTNLSLRAPPLPAA